VYAKTPAEGGFGLVIFTPDYCRQSIKLSFPVASVVIGSTLEVGTPLDSLFSAWGRWNLPTAEYLVKKIP